MKKLIFCLLILGVTQFSWSASARNKKPRPKASAPVQTVPAPPSAQAAAAAAPVVKAPPEVILPLLTEYKYEVNMAPLALLANWYTVDILKYDPAVGTGPDRFQFAYGIAAASFIRNNNNASDTFPSRSGYGGGVVATWDYLDYYYTAHAYYEKFERYQSKGDAVQEREGARINAVVGLKEVIKRRFALKFGYGIEVQSYKVREFNESNRFVQANYTTNILNPFFIECKLSAYF